MRRGRLSSELLMCGGGVRSILLLPLVARCPETIYYFIWCMFVFTFVVVYVWRPLLKILGFSLGVLKYAVCLCSGCDGCLLMLVEDARGDHMEEAYSRAGFIIVLKVAMSVSFRLPHPVVASAFMICSGLCACTEMLWMCVLYVSFGSKVRPRTFGCVAMGSALFCIFAGSDMNIVQIVLS